MSTTKFKRGEVTLEIVKSGNVTVPCIIHGTLAVHRDHRTKNKEFWTVSHVPTGRRAARYEFYSQRQAKIYAIELEKIFQGAQTMTEIENCVDADTGERLANYCAYVANGGIRTFRQYGISLRGDHVSV